MKFELKSPESSHQGRSLVHGTQVALNGEKLSDVCNVVLSFPAGDLINLEVEQLVRGEDGNLQVVGEVGQKEFLKQVRKFYLTTPISLDLKVEEWAGETQPE